MATDKMFTVVGVSTHKGQTKVRWANDFARIKILDKEGHTDVDLIELPHPMNKVDALKHYYNLKKDSLSPDADFALTTRIEDIEEEQKRSAFKIISKKPNKSEGKAPEFSLDKIRARAKSK